MNIVLVNPPNHQHDLDDLAPPLGLLILAEALLDNGFSVNLLDLNLDSCRDQLPPLVDFYPAVCERILRLKPDAVCFTSMGINSHVALELARHLKQKHSSIITIVGGPHFGSIARTLKRRFPWIDYVVSGAGESAIVRIINNLKDKRRITRVDFDVASSDDLISTMFGHPWHAYSLLSLSDYFTTNERRVLNLETGRGCKYKCRFCYSPNHWRNTFDFDQTVAVDDFTHAATVGAKHVFVVQDNLLNDSRATSALCMQLAGISPRPSWHCYGTLRDIAVDTPHYLAHGGCTSIYIGIDAATKAQKRQFGKSSFDSEAVCVEKVRALVAESVIPTCAFILDTVNWSEDELEASLRLAMTLRMSGAELSLHFLTAYSNTALAKSLPDGSTAIADDFRIRLMFDCPDVVIENPFVENHADLFPFHTRNIVDASLHRRAVAFVHLGQFLISEYPHELSDLVANNETRIIDILGDVYSGISLSEWNSPDPMSVRLASQLAIEDLFRKSFGFVSVN